MNFQKILMSLLTSLTQARYKSAPTPTPPAPTNPPPAPAQEEPAPKINWSDPSSRISRYFTVHEATFLHSWGVHHQPSEEERRNILAMAKNMDLIRDLLGVSIEVHAWMRPSRASCPGTPWDQQDYNRYVYENEVWKGLTEAEKASRKVPDSPHKEGKAVDWHSGQRTPEDCARVRALLLPHLEPLGIRMEDAQGSWVHTDIRPVISRRFFKP